MPKGHNNTGRSISGGKFVQVHHFMMDCAAWLALSANGRAAYLEIAKLYNGTNNGFLFMSALRLSELLGVSKATAARTMRELLEKGFIEITKPSAFSVKTRLATEYRLTLYRCDRTNKLPSKKFTLWKPT